MLPEPVKRFVDIFSQLPSIGPRQATRLAFHLLSIGKNNLNELAKVVSDLGQLKTCSECFNSYSGESGTCQICGNPQRQWNIIMVVEKETDLISIEKTNKYIGRYFIVGDLKKGAAIETEQKLRLNSLKARIKKQGQPAEEIILAINPTTYGDFGAGLLADELKGWGKKITRLGRGIPTGGEIEFADIDTLSNSLLNRS